jgi:hypothetical protein
VCGVVSFPLWLGSYAWIPFRLAGRDSERIWTVVVASELSAMVLGLVSIMGGVLTIRTASRSRPECQRARQGIVLGLLVWVCIISFNAIGLFWL